MYLLVWSPVGGVRAASRSSSASELRSTWRRTGPDPRAAATRPPDGREIRCHLIPDGRCSMPGTPLPSREMSSKMLLLLVLGRRAAGCGLRQQRRRDVWGERVGEFGVLGSLDLEDVGFVGCNVDPGRQPLREQPRERGRRRHRRDEDARGRPEGRGQARDGRWARRPRRGRSARRRDRGRCAEDRGRHRQRGRPPRGDLGDYGHPRHDGRAGRRGRRPAGAARPGRRAERCVRATPTSARASAPADEPGLADPRRRRRRQHRHRRDAARPAPGAGGQLLQRRRSGVPVSSA